MFPFHINCTQLTISIHSIQPASHSVIHSSTVTTHNVFIPARHFIPFYRHLLNILATRCDDEESLSLMAQIGVQEEKFYVNHSLVYSLTCNSPVSAENNYQPQVGMQEKIVV